MTVMLKMTKCIPLQSPQVLELLWDLAHLPAIRTHLVEQALEEHHTILSVAYSVKEHLKLQYVHKCVDDIKKVRSLL